MQQHYKPTTADHVECSQTPNTENTSSESLTKLNYISSNIVNLALWNCEKCRLKLTYLSLQICPEKKKKRISDILKNAAFPQK